MADQLHTGVFELHWEQDTYGAVSYELYRREQAGQLAFVSSTIQGPFDTALEIAHWAWRHIAREVPPATC